MSDFMLILSSLKARWLNSLLSVFLTAFGIMLALIIVQFGHHVQNRLSADGQGVDIVVGAKGSPLQLILSSVYHIDIPTGNIPYKDAEKWMRHRLVKSAIPLALGDNWKGYRIVGTTPEYMNHYGADISTGRQWDVAFEAVVGASVGLNVGDEFEGAHGLMEGGHVHGDTGYKVTGVLKPTGTVLDRLILTSLDSVLEIHGHQTVGHAHGDHGHEQHDDHKEDHHDHGHEQHDDHKEDNHDHGHEHHDDHEEDHHGHGHEPAAEPEVTALLITTKSPVANINIPRMINRETALQAANPALEMARLTGMLGLGAKTFFVLSSVLIIIAALNIFAGIAGSLDNRMADLAVLRAIGYSKARVFRIIVSEGLVIVLTGMMLGVVLGVVGFSFIADIITPLSASKASVSVTPEFSMILISVLVAGLVAAALPAFRASRVDVALQLSRST